MWWDSCWDNQTCAWNNQQENCKYIQQHSWSSRQIRETRFNETTAKIWKDQRIIIKPTTNNLALSDTCSTSMKLMKFTSSVSYLMLHYRWNVEKKQVTPSRPTPWHHKGIVWVQINVHTISQKCSHHLHRTTRPRIHVTNNTHSPMYTPNTIIQS